MMILVVFLYKYSLITEKKIHSVAWIILFNEYSPIKRPV